MIPEVLDEAREKMEAAIEHVQSEFGTVRTGRANPVILHRILVDYYGVPTPLQQLASFAVPEPHLLVVQPFDKNSIGAVERAISASDLGIHPSSDGHVLRLVFPALTEERRKDLVKLVAHMAEEGKVAVRNIRRHAKESIEALEGEISEDDIRRGERDLQHLTDEHTARIDELLHHKQAELLEV